MSQQQNEVAVNYGTMDANGIELLAQLKRMIIELQGLGVPGVQPILDKYGFSNVDWSATAGFHIKSRDQKKFLG